ncbi:UNVERIFIED_ORG: hypothetical protein LHK14_14695 [Roseateles sp. XES5]|nr:hypothetical protein [Roseateles sp. XES5]
MPTSHARLFLKAILAVSAFFAGPAMALQPCPPQDELLANAKVVVEARVKSLSIGDSGLLLPISSRMVRADLQIERVIKGQ